MSRIAITMKLAARSLFDKGYHIDDVVHILKNLEQPTPDYVYADQMPGEKTNALQQNT